MDDAASPDARAERHLQMLQELGELGMRLARTVTAQAVEQAGDPDRDLGLVFSRIARAVRQTIALEARLAADRQAWIERLQAEAASQAQTAAAQAAAAAWAPYAARQATVRRAVARAIRLDVHDDEDEDLLEALEDHLDDWSSNGRFLERPIGELVARICSDLGVAATPALWADDDWAIAEAQAKPPATPDGAPPSEAFTDPPGPTHHPPDHTH